MKSSRPKPGELIQGRYELQSVLGEGGFGVVYRAVQRPTGQAVAIKVLLPEKLLASRDAQLEEARFEREMRLISRLKHPNIVRLIDSGRLDGGQLFTVLELVEGGSLAEVLKEEGPMPLATVQRLMTQVLEALHCAHALGVVHRDLKPGNIMVTQVAGRRNAMVLDFGIASLTDDAREGDFHTLTATGQVHGTPGYMAPEQLEGVLTPQSDLYAWGLVFIECLTGRPAVEGASLAKIIFEQLSETPVSLPENIRGTALGTLLTRATAKPLEARYRSAGELLAELDHHGPHSLRLNAVSGAEAPSDSSPRAMPWRAFLVAVGAAALVAVVLWWPRGDRRPETTTAGRSCPLGQEVTASTHGQCCWAGQVWATNRCVGVPDRCPDGYEVDAEGQRCSPRACYGGRERTLEQRCCWPGQGWDQGAMACVGSPRCAAPYMRSGDGCMKLSGAAWADHAGCEGGDAEGCHRLGVRLLGMPGEEAEASSDRALAIKFLSRACAATPPVAKACVWQGLGVGALARESRNDEEALRLFRRACEAGEPDGCFNEAWGLIQGLEGRSDQVNGELRLRRACELGHGAACKQVGQLFASGWLRGAPRPEEATPFLERACELGDAYGCTHLGLSLIEREGVIPVEVVLKAYHLFSTACRQGVAPACDLQNRIKP